MGSWAWTCRQPLGCCQCMSVSSKKHLMDLPYSGSPESLQASLLTQMCLPLLQTIKPTVLIGTSGKGQTFTQEVVEAISSFNEVTFTKSTCLFPSLLIQRSYKLMVFCKKNAEANHSCPVQPNVAVWVHCWASLHMEQGNDLYQQAHHFFLISISRHITSFSEINIDRAISYVTLSIAMILH